MSIRRRNIQARVEHDRKFEEGMDRLKAGLWELQQRIELAQKRGLKRLPTHLRRSE